MNLNICRVLVLLGLYSSLTVSLAFQLKQSKRDDQEHLSVGQLFAQMLDSILGDTKNVTVNSTTLPSTFSWFTNKFSTNTAGTSKGTPTQTSTKLSTSSQLGVSNTSNVNLPSKNVTVTSDGNVTLAPTLSRPSSTTFVLLGERCGAEFTLTELCGTGLSSLLVDLNIWDVYGIMFSNDVIEALLLNCATGHWCLYDEFSYWNGLMMEKAAMVKDSEIFSQICQSSSLSCFDTFLNNVTGCPIQERMNFTVEAINMLCDMRNDHQLDLTCYGHLLAAYHVTVVEFLRDKNNKKLQEGVFENAACQSPEVLMTKSVLCVEAKCPSHNELLLNFSPWQWFSPNVSKIKEDCHLPADTCDEDATFGPTATTSTYMTTDEPMTSSLPTQTTIIPGMANDALSGSGNGDDGNTNDGSFVSEMTMILGVCAGIIIAVSGLFVLIYSCWRKHGLRRIDKVGYTPLRNQD